MRWGGAETKKPSARLGSELLEWPVLISGMTGPAVTPT
ncbi:hypothetical protein [Pseudomonas phage Shamal]